MRPTKSLIRNAGVPSTAASAVMVWLSPRKNAAPASAWWMRSGRRRDAQPFELRGQRLLAGDEDAQAAADAVHERAQEGVAHAFHAAVVMRLQRAQPDDGVGLRVRDPQVARGRSGSGRKRFGCR